MLIVPHIMNDIDITYLKAHVQLFQGPNFDVMQTL